ncbi:hypothetical protein HK405_000133, partial [Cladochytrium tenue]
APRRPSVPRGVFGLPLEHAVATTRISESLELPAVVYRCIDYLLVMRALDEEGIYRLSGSSTTVQQLRARFDSELDVDLVAGEPCDVHAVASLLKLYLRELPENVLTQALLADFHAVLDLDDRTDRVARVAELVGQLPLAHRTLLQVLCSHLVDVVQRCDVNRMTLRNVAIVFSATLAAPQGLFALMLAEYDAIFGAGGTGGLVA